MSDTQLTSMAKIIANKLNAIIDKVNDNTNDKANLSGAEFSGEISLSGIKSDILPTENSVYDLGSDIKRYRRTYTDEIDMSSVNISINSDDELVLRHLLSQFDSIKISPDGSITLNNSYRMPLNDGESGDVMATDGNGNLIFKALDTQSSDFSRYILSTDIIGDGLTSDYNLDATSVNKVMYVEVNGLIQKENENYTYADKVVSFFEPLPEGATGTIMFWGNDVREVIHSYDIIADGSATSFPVGSDVNKIIYVELNGLIQKEGINYTLDTLNDVVTFSEAPLSGVTGTILYV
jgi:hypothetical protein